jgi:hypothetical protein
VKSKFIENYTTLHPLFASERAAIVTGIDLVSKTFDASQTLLFTDPKIRSGKELNETKEELIQIAPYEDIILVPKDHK